MVQDQQGAEGYGEAKGYDLGQNPTNSLLALFPGGIIIIPALITYWRGTKRVQGASKLGGKEPVNGWIALLLYLFIAPGMWAYLQVSLNHVWEQEAEPLPGHEAPPALRPDAAAPAGRPAVGPASPQRRGPRHRRGSPLRPLVT